jgi:predicted outer membrane protein
MLSLSRSVRWAAVSGTFVLLTASLSTAAEPGNRAGGPATDAGGPRRVVADKPVAEAMSPAQRRDRQIADWLVQCNQNEIALAKFAASKTENQQVRQFAEMLEKDHMQCLDKLRRFAGPTADATDAAIPGTGNTAARRGGVDVVAPFVEVAVDGNGRAGVPESADGQGGLNFLAVQRQIGQRFLDLIEKEWESKPAHHRDMAFVGRQLVMHEHLIATEEVLRQYASPELQPLLDSGLKEAHSHWNDAKSLIEELAHQEHSSK